jgi:hypothetical protein
MTNAVHEHGARMTLGNMREEGMHHLIAYCLHDACRHQTV